MKVKSKNRYRCILLIGMIIVYMQSNYAMAESLSPVNDQMSFLAPFLQVENNILLKGFKGKLEEYYQSGQIFVPLSVLGKQNVRVFINEAIDIQRSGAQGIHFDVRQEEYFTYANRKNANEDYPDNRQEFTPELIKKLSEAVSGKIDFDVHLLCWEPSFEYIKSFADLAAVASIDLQYDAFKDKQKLIEALGYIRSFGRVRAGLVIEKNEAINDIPDDILKQVDMFVITAVETAKVAGKADVTVFDKVPELRSRGFFNKVMIQGGVEGSNIAEAAFKGATKFVVGSFLSKQPTKQEAVKILKEQIAIGKIKKTEMFKNHIDKEFQGLLPYEKQKEISFFDQLKQAFLAGIINEDELLEIIFARMDRSLLLPAPNDLIGKAEAYRSGGMIVKNWLNGNDIENNLLVRFRTLAPAILSDGLSDAKIHARFSEVLNRFIDKDRIYEWTNHEVCNFLWIIMRVASGYDPQLLKKQLISQEAIGLLEVINKHINTSADPMGISLKLSAIANCIDFADPKVRAAIAAGTFNIEEIIGKDMGIQNFWKLDNTDQIYKILNSKKKLRIVYVADNAGETEIDVIGLINQLLLRGHEVILAGNSRPMLNDYTAEDLRSMLEQPKLKQFLGKAIKRIKVIETGTIGFGVDLQRLDLEFKEQWEKADVVIFKGQANYFHVRKYEPLGKSIFILKAKSLPELKPLIEQGDYIAEYLFNNSSSAVTLSPVILNERSEIAVNDMLVFEGI